MNKLHIKKPKLVFTILLILLFVLFLLYYKLFISPSLRRMTFANEIIEISEENENSVFNIQKILLYSNANAVDNSEDHSLQNMSLSQYTDLSIYIDNTSYITELTDENTIKEMYIDNISIDSKSKTGNKILNYKNPLDSGKYTEISKPKNGRIDFNIVHTNSENESTDYSKPTFYTDCSNPISLGYLNKDFLTNYSVSADSNQVSFNGKVLKEANVNIDEINYTLKFTIHIINNLNENFEYNIAIDVDLNDENGGIYNGYVSKSINTTGNNYRFFKKPSK